MEVGERRLWREDEIISLAPKQFDLLFYFVENAGRTAKKSELLDAVWADAYVEETTLARNVSWLRKMLEDGANGERIIETVPKIGYRFTSQVTRSNEEAFAESNETELIIEEQIVQYVRGEEIITIDNGDADLSPKTEIVNYKSILPKVSELPRRRVALYSFFAPL